jgi:hypothetical protein
LFPPYELTQSGYEITQTFGQLIMHEGELKPAYFAVLKMPTTAHVRTISDGTIRYVADFQALGPSLILTPKGYLISTSDFDRLEGLPRPAKVRLVFANLVESEVRTAVENRYSQLGVSDAAAAADRFIAGHEDNREVDVEARANVITSTIVGKAVGGELYIAAFEGELDAVEAFVNPLPFMLAGIPAASHSVIDNEPPQIVNVALYADTDPALIDPMVYEVPATNRIDPPNILYGHVAVQAQIEDRARMGGVNLGLYEFSYEVNRVTRDGTGAITSRVLMSKGRHLANRIELAAPPFSVDLYNADRSSAGTRTFWYKLAFDLTDPPVPDPPVRNYTADANPRTLDVSGYTSGEYEFVLRARDAVMPSAAPVERTVYAQIDNAPSAIAEAQWGLRGQMGPVSSEADRNGETAFLILPAAGTPFTVQTSLVNAPSVSSPAQFRYSVNSNGTVVPTSDAGLFPSGNDIYPGAVGLTFSGPGLHDLIVWLDQDGDDTRQESESWRRLVIMTYDPAPTITAERKHLGGPWAPLTPGTLIPTADGLRLTLSASFQMGHDASAVYSWEVDTPSGQETLSGSGVWEKDPFPAGGGGEWEAKGIIELFGVRFERKWTQTVVGAAIPAVQAICEDQNRNVAVTLAPSPLPVGQQVDYSIDRPGNLANGNATFTDGSVAATANASGSLTLRGVRVSNAKDNVALVAQYDGAEIAREAFSVCAIRFVDRNKNETDTLRIARWDNAYGAAPGFAVRNATAPANNFVDQDPRRLFIRVHDFSKDTTAGRDRVEARVGTRDTVSDNLTRMQLFETGNHTGIFESTSQLLMSPDLPAADNPDDDFAANDGNGHNKADDTLNDRTHRASIFSRLVVRYDPEPAVQYRDSLDICGDTPTTRRRRIWLRVHVFFEPFRDIGYDHDGSAATPNIGASNGTFDFNDTAPANGQHDPGEASEPFMDLSSGAAAFGVAGSRGGVVTVAQVQQQVSRATIAWAQACIEMRMQPGSPHFQEADSIMVAGVNTSILQDGDIDLSPGADEPAVVAAFAGAAHVDTVVVLFGAPIAGSNAVSRTPSDGIAGMAEFTFVYLNPNLDIRFRTLAHEIGHVLDNQWDAANPQPVFYPANATFRDNALNQYRRVTAATEGNVRTCRAAGAAMAVGNRILKRPASPADVAVCP